MTKKGLNKYDKTAHYKSTVYWEYTLTPDQNKQKQAEMRRSYC